MVIANLVKLLKLYCLIGECLKLDGELRNRKYIRLQRHFCPKWCLHSESLGHVLNQWLYWVSHAYLDEILNYYKGFFWKLYSLWGISHGAVKVSTKVFVKSTCCFYRVILAQNIKKSWVRNILLVTRYKIWFLYHISPGAFPKNLIIYRNMARWRVKKLLKVWM